QEHSEQDEVLDKDEVQTDDEQHGIDSEEESEEIRYEKVSEQKQAETGKTVSKDNDFEINKQLDAKHDEKLEQKSQNKHSIHNTYLTKIEKHWPIIAIILAIILIFILVWSIFQNVNPPNESRKTIEEKQSQKGFQKPITNVMEAVEKSKNSV